MSLSQIIFHVSSISILVISFNLGAIAQVKPDKTLGPRSTKLQGQRIVGGLRAGQNLFHSFSQFSIPLQGKVYFRNPRGVQNIFSRVTGSQPSNIQGTLGVLGKANLFFLNKNGIYFDESAILNVNNHFLASTANRILFDSETFSSNNLPKQNLLSTKPIALSFNGNRNAPIHIKSKSRIAQRPDYQESQNRNLDRSGLGVDSGKSLLLLGGDIFLQNSGLNAFSGSIEIGSFATGGEARLNFNSDNTKLLLPKRFNGGTVEFTENSVIDVSGERIGSAAGSVNINAHHIKLSGSDIQSEANSSTDGGRISLRALGNFLMTGEMTQTSEISVLTGGKGKGSTLVIDANHFTAKDGSVLSGPSFGDGQGGGIIINAKQKFELMGVDSNQNRTLIITNATAQGEAGDVEVRVANGDLFISHGALISSASEGNATGAGGTVKLSASGTISLRGESNLSPGGGVNVITETIGQAGNIEIDAKRLRVLQGDELVADTLGPGRGGNITILAEESVLVDGFFMFQPGEFNLSRIQAASSGTGDGGNISIITKDVTISNFAQIAAASTPRSGLNPAMPLPGKSAGGNISISANNLTLETASIQSQSARNSPNRSSSATILLNISDSIQLGNPNSVDNTFISTRAFKKANGGNIFIINTPQIAATNAQSFGNDIIASAANGRGGNIIINAQSIDGLTPPSNRRLSPLENNGINDINATGRVPGVVNIDTVSELDQGLIEFPEVVIDPNALVAQNPCSSSNDSEFTLSGHGGLPLGTTNTIDSLQSQVKPILSDTVPPTASQDNVLSNNKRTPNSSSQAPIQGWKFDRQGKVQLVAYQNQKTLQGYRQQKLSASCQR